MDLIFECNVKTQARKFSSPGCPKFPSLESEKWNMKRKNRKFI